ncbi:MAG: DNA polymerase I [Proteobacteria bacterium]|nr:MAG: DNA polymerase I [Pseudomonadota bacterium]PIE39891.1 MAG: DNA polymerase I [Gammaproteobacteria bacterium]
MNQSDTTGSTATTATSPSSPLAILVDGSSYLFRAFHALPPLTTSKGQPTGAVRGVIAMLRRMQQDYPKAKIIVIFDAKGKNFRHELYEDYKANRPPMPEELREQIAPVHEIIKAMGLPLLVIPDVEADDVIGTLAHQASRQGIETLVSTGDKDMAQLVSPHVMLVNTMDNSRLDEQGVFDKFGVRPNQIVDYLALMGDKVDNIPGVPKCGPRTAVKWLTEFGSLEGVIANADKVKGKIGENLRASIASLPLSYRLATIKTDVELEQNLADIEPGSPDTTKLLELFRQLEFKSWITGLSDSKNPTSPPANASSDMKEPGGTPEPVATIQAEYETILTRDHFETWLAELDKAELFAFDTETTSLNYMEAEIAGVSFAITPGKAAYVPVAHDYPGAPEQLDRDYVLQQLKPLLESDKPRIIGQNLKYDRNVLIKYGIVLGAIAHDTMLESYVLDSTGTRHDMDSLSLRYLGHNTITFEDIAGKGAKQLTFNQIELDKAAPYAAEDADITLRLHQVLNEKLSRDTANPVYQDIELPLVSVLSKIEHNGAKIDARLLQSHSIRMAERLKELEKKAFDLAGEEFNPGSPKQLQSVFYEKLGFRVIKKTPKGQPSTAEPVLQELALEYELPRIILEHRSLSKLKSTYTDRLPDQINPVTGRIHTSYHQAVTATGRLSSSDPNLQNIPIRTEEGRKIRQAFVPREGCKLIAADYSQIELRIMAHLSKDVGLLRAFAEGKDIHKATAGEVFSVDESEVTGDQRRSAKAINFGLIYGMSDFGLSRQLSIDRATAKSYIGRYFDRYPGVLDYMERTKKTAHDQGYVETLFGRKLYLPEINARNKMRQQAAERTAINAPMQGSAADIIKRAMILVDSWLTETKTEAKIIMQVHDELVLEVPERDAGKVKQEIVELMAKAARLDVPLLVEAGIGNNWDEAH